MVQPNVVVSGTCRKCNAERNVERFATFASATFGPCVDLGLGMPITGSLTSNSTTVSGSINPASGTANWACYLDGSCWEDMRSEVWWAARPDGRVWTDHDRVQGEFQATLSGISGATLSGMLTLDPPYQITQDGLDGYFADVEPHMHLLDDLHQWNKAVASGTRPTTLAALRTTYSGHVGDILAEKVDHIPNFNNYAVTTISGLTEPSTGDLNKTEIVDEILIVAAQWTTESGSALCCQIVRNHLQLPTWYPGDGVWTHEAEYWLDGNGTRVMEDRPISISGAGWVPWGLTVPAVPDPPATHYVAEASDIILPGYTYDNPFEE